MQSKPPPFYRLVLTSVTMAPQDSTHIRIPTDLKKRLLALCNHRETIADVIERLLTDGNKQLTELTDTPSTININQEGDVQDLTRLLSETREQVERLNQEVQTLKNAKSPVQTVLPIPEEINPIVNIKLTHVNNGRVGSEHVTPDEKIALADAIEATIEKFRPMIKKYQDANNEKNFRKACKEVLGFNSAENASYRKDGSITRRKYTELMNLIENAPKNPQ